MSSAPDRHPGRRAATALVVVLGFGGLAACGQDAVVPEVTTDELRDVQDDVAALEERVAELETAQSSAPPAGETAAPPSPTTDAPPAEPTLPFGADDDVSFRAEVVGLVSTSDIGSAFQVSTPSGAPVTVVSATPVDGLTTGELVQVSGIAVPVEETTFERDFGIAAAVLLDDPDAFFAEQAGQLAVSADQVQRDTPG